MKKLLFALSIALLLSACDCCQTGDEIIAQDHYITQYIDIDQISNEIINQTIVIKYYLPSELDLASDEFAPISTFATGNDKIIYDSLANKHNDNEYHYEITYPTLFGKKYTSIATFAPMFDIASIEIYSDDDYDEQHLAGTSLNECFTFTTISRYPFFESNYQSTCSFTQNSKEYALYFLFDATHNVSGKEDLKWDSDGTYQTAFHIINKALDSVSTKDLTLAGCASLMSEGLNGKDRWCAKAFTLEAKTPPTLAKMQHFTIKVNADNGQTYTTKCTVAFE